MAHGVCKKYLWFSISIWSYLAMAYLENDKIMIGIIFTMEY